MNRHTLRVLEFEKVRERVRSRCLTEEAAHRLRKSRVSTDPAEVAASLARVQAVRRCLESAVEFPSLAFPPVVDAIGRLAVEGAVLEPRELAAIGVFARSSLDLVRYLERAGTESGAEVGLLEPITRVPELADLSAHLLRHVDADGSVREREIPELRALRQEIHRAQQDLQRTAAALMGGDESRRLWSAEVPTQREGRTVLPLKADHRGRVRGIVHEVSASGATVFIEPEELIARNNAVVEAEQRYRNEVLRILKQLSALCRSRLDELTACMEACVELDLVYARARHGLDFACVPAVRSADAVSLRGARHPLLEGRAVPITVSVPAGKRVLIITGPNTGGKTVALKTIGLLALMNQFGLEIPASAGSELPVLSGIYADIGDEQSIEQSLSTFSGHMRNIARILNHADADSLVLLDELGSGTDPEEGGALAMAVLDELLRRGPFTVVTTHHGRLKHYGFTRPEAANASVEFDAHSLRPTYHIIPGVPGSSHAVDVAAQMGILRSVTAAARHYLSGEEYDTGRIIRTLTDREQELHREREEAKEVRAALEREMERLGERAAELDQRESRLRTGRLQELERWAAEARSRLENTVRELREGELTREKTVRVKELIRDLGDELAAQRASAAPAGGPHSRRLPRGAAGVPVTPFEGARVRISASRKEGVVHRRGKGSTWIVQTGGVRLPVDESELQVIAEEGAEAAAGPSISYASAGSRPALELDLRGYRLEEARDAVLRQVDAAMLAGLKQFSIIHGTGEGVLQAGVRDLLRTHPGVSRFEFAAPEAGGFGKTDVTLA